MPSRSDGVCDCGHPYESHDFIDGFDCSPGVLIDGITGTLDLIVCGGGRLAPAGGSPWDHVCGCILHPNTRRNVRLYEESRHAV